MTTLGRRTFLASTAALGVTADMTAILKDFPITQTTFEQYVRRVVEPRP